MTTHDVGRLRRTGGLAVAAALLFVGPALADESVRAAAAPGVDADIQSEVVDAVLGYVHYGVFDSVGVGVDDGVVTLVGSVYQPWRRDELVDRVARLTGVREIKNELRVQPASIFDDRLRAQLYRRIYGNEMFVRYASFVNPPIRIVVENGKVTLTGVVNSNVERVVLGSIANGTLAFSVDNQVQIESEIRKEPASKSKSGTIDI
jgi:hyperosmotically inducible periplasmic protein